jgi:hypothetical protein
MNEREKVLPVGRGPTASGGGPSAFGLFAATLGVVALVETVVLVVVLRRGAPTTYWLPFAAAGAILLLVARPWQPGLSRPATSAELARSGRPL